MKRKNLLLRQLIENILKTSSHNEIDSYFETAQMLCSSQIISSQPHSIKTWSKKWIPTIKESQQTDFKRVIRELPKEKFQIYKIFDILKHSKKDFIVTKQNPSISRSSRISKHYLTDAELIRELIVLLQGGKSGILTFIDNRLSSEGLMMEHQKACVLRIARNALCLSTIQDAINTLDGIIGQALAAVLQKEKSDYITAMLAATNEMSLLSLLSFSCSIESQRLEAAAFVSNLIEQSSQDEIFFTLAQTQDHGSKFVIEIGQKCIAASTKAFLAFIKEWVVFGKLDDPYEEFFIHENDEDVANCDWWDKKFEVRSEKIPPFIQKDSTVSDIVASGRAWNFIREYKRKAMEISGPKARQMLSYETEGKDIHFSMTMLPQCLKESMKKAINIIKNVIWVSGHIKAITDLILMQRGDFAISLFDTFLNVGAPVSLLETAIISVIDKKIYTNPSTKESLTDCLDVQLTASRTLDPSPEAIALIYNAPSDLTYILDDSLVQCYIDVGKLVWKIKCAERRLLLQWKMSKNVSLFFDASSTSSQPQNALRFEMVTAMRAIFEFFTMDVISCNQRDLLMKINEICNVDDLLKLIRTQTVSLKNRCFLTQDSADLLSKIEVILESIDQMCTIQEDLDQRVDEIAESLDDDNQQDNFASITQKMRVTKDALISSIQALAADFHEALMDLYEYSLNDQELNRLESRLVFCVQHLLE